MKRRLILDKDINKLSVMIEIDYENLPSEQEKTVFDLFQKIDSLSDEQLSKLRQVIGDDC